MRLPRRSKGGEESIEKKQKKIGQKEKRRRPVSSVAGSQGEDRASKKRRKLEL